LSLRRAGAEWIIFLYGTIWISDSFAFYIGKSVGRKKLYSEVSPKKTVEGAIGSLLGGVISAVAIRALFIESMAPGAAALVGLALGAVAVVGDLVESMFKRDAGVKDSSSLIPGHGGLLDKIDGPLFGGPALFWILQALGIITA
jgi:phosphatidate cytidylyltransferase